MMPRNTSNDSEAAAPVLLNITDGELVHQRCVLVRGTVGATSGRIQVDVCCTRDALKAGDSESPSSRRRKPLEPIEWPLVQGHFKALIELQPGTNFVRFAVRATAPKPDLDQLVLSEPPAYIDSVNSLPHTIIELSYTPLLQIPPLHLAIMVAGDSPSLMDAPPSHAVLGGHTSLAAAVAKVRLAAYLWQAQVADNMHSEGLGRKSFRLDETLDADTMRLEREQDRLVGRKATAKRATAKVHVVRSDRTTEEIRKREYCEQEHSSDDAGALYDFFLEALEEYGGPFAISEAGDEEETPIVVAGLILDTHWDRKAKMLVGHNAVGGNSGTDGKVRLAMFGSHTCWAWPRWMDELVGCMLDTARPGPSVANGDGDYSTAWEAVAAGQGGMLHEIGHALGSPHSSRGIMAQGYLDWPRSFLPLTSYCVRTGDPGIRPVASGSPNQNVWSISDLVRFRNHPLFWQPQDGEILSDSKSPLRILSSGEPPMLKIECGDGLAVIEWTNDSDDVERKERLPGPPLDPGSQRLSGDSAPLEVVFERSYSLRQLRQAAGNADDEYQVVGVKALAWNGQSRHITDCKALLSSSWMSIPSSKLRFKKVGISIKSSIDDGDVHAWATLLTRRKEDGSVDHAKRLELRLGAWMDGAYLDYRDPHEGILLAARAWEKRKLGGDPLRHELSAESRIVKISVAADDDFIRGLELGFVDGSTIGRIDKTGSNGNITEIDVDADQLVVGLYGKSMKDYDSVVEFGLLTVPRGTDLTTTKAYSMWQLNVEERRKKAEAE